MASYRLLPNRIDIPFRFNRYIVHKINTAGHESNLPKDRDWTAVKSCCAQRMEQY